MGAVLIDGPKSVGKRRTAEQVAGTVLRMDVDQATRAALEVAPGQLFGNPTTIVFGEWQEAPELWNLVRLAVDDHAGKGLQFLTSSSRPPDDAKMHFSAGRIARLRMRPMSLFEPGTPPAKSACGDCWRGRIPPGQAQGWQWKTYLSAPLLAAGRICLMSVNTKRHCGCETICALWPRQMFPGSGHARTLAISRDFSLRSGGALGRR